MNSPLDPSLRAYFDALTDKVNDASLSRFEWFYLGVMVLQTVVLVLYCIETWRLRKSAAKQTELFREQISTMSEQNKTLRQQLDLAAKQLSFQEKEAGRQAEVTARQEEVRQQEKLREEERRALEIEPFYLFEKGANANGSLSMIVHETKKTGAIEKMRTSSTGVTKNKINPDTPFGFSLTMPNNQAKVIYVGFKYRTSAGTESKQVFSIDTGTQDHRKEPDMSYDGLACGVINS